MPLPAFTITTNQNHLVGSILDIPITAAYDAGVTYSSTALPSGLTIFQNRIQGVVHYVGVTSVTITLDDGVDTSDLVVSFDVFSTGTITIDTTSKQLFNHGGTDWRSYAPADSGLYTVDSNNITYEGSFSAVIGRRPVGSTEADPNSNTGDSTEFRVLTIAPNGDMIATGNSKGTGGNYHIARFNRPALSLSSNANDLNLADVQSGYKTLLGGAGNYDLGDETITGLAVDTATNKIIVGLKEYYDGDGDETHNVKVVSQYNDLIASTVSGAFKISTPDGARVGGIAVPIPSSFQASFGGATHLMCGAPAGQIVDRLSMGPSAYAVNMSDITGATAAGTEISATACLVYPHVEGQVLCGSLANLFTSVIWNHVSHAGGALWVPNTRTILFIGHNWTGEGELGYRITNDLGVASNGYNTSIHSAYQNYYWAYDANDLISAFNGSINPWDARPYAHGQFPHFTFVNPALPNSTTSFARRVVRGAAFDYQNNKLICHVFQGGADRGADYDTFAQLDLGL